MTPLLLVAAADTMLVRQVSQDRTTFEQVVFVSAGLAQVITLVVVVLLAVIFFRMWKAQQAMQEQLGRLSAKVDPMIASATAAAENVRVLTDVVRKDAVAAADALSEATVRVRDSVGGIADRIDDFGDLLGRVTGKAEAVADLASAAVTTVKAGSRLFRPAQTPTHRPERARHVRADFMETPDGEADAPRRLADDEGHESPYADDAPDAQAAPRRRRKRRRRGSGGGGGASGGEASGGGDTPPS